MQLENARTRGMIDDKPVYSPSGVSAGYKALTPDGEILRPEAARKERRKIAASTDDTGGGLVKALNVAYARAHATHRRATETFEVKVFEC